MGYCNLCGSYSKGLRGFGEEVGGCLHGGALFKVCKSKGSHVKTGSLVRRPEGMKTQRSQDKAVLSECISKTK